MDDAEVTNRSPTSGGASRAATAISTQPGHATFVWRSTALGTGRHADRALLIGAYFTRECSLETAALFNPSIVAHPDQSGTGTDGRPGS